MKPRRVVKRTVRHTSYSLPQAVADLCRAITRYLDWRMDHEDPVRVAPDRDDRPRVGELESVTWFNLWAALAEDKQRTDRLHKAYIDAQVKP